MSLRDVVDAMARALESPTDGAFRQVGSLLADAKAAVREALQGRTAPQVAAIIKKLKADQEITSQDIALIRLWVVGDAEGYVEAENDFQNWLQEYARLREAFGRYADGEWSTDDMVRLQGLIEDSVRVSFDLANYLEKKERVENFDQTTRDPKSINKEVLAALLSRKLQSDKA